MRRWGLNPVLGYLAAGALFGPLGFGSLIGAFPFLYWVTVVDAKNAAGIAQLDVVFGGKADANYVVFWEGVS